MKFVKGITAWDIRLIDFLTQQQTNYLSLFSLMRHEKWSCMASSLRIDRGPTLFGGGTARAPRRPTTPLQKQVFCSAGAMWIGARPRLLLSNGSSTEAELRLPLERERWFQQQTTLVNTGVSFEHSRTEDRQCVPFCCIFMAHIFARICIEFSIMCLIFWSREVHQTFVQIAIRFWKSCKKSAYYILFFLPLNKRRIRETYRIFKKSKISLKSLLLTKTWCMCVNNAPFFTFRCKLHIETKKTMLL